MGEQQRSVRRHGARPRPLGGGRHGAVDASAYDRSPPGGGANDSGDRACQGALMDAGCMDNLGRWTGKAASHGVKNDVDFLDHPETQEAAMTDALRVYDRQARALGVDRYVGQVITGLNGSQIRITRAGIIAAGRRAAVPAVSAYLRWKTTGQTPTTKQDKDVVRYIEPSSRIWTRGLRT